MSSTQEAINKARCAETLDIWGEKAREKAKKNIRVGRTYEDIINATDSIWIDGEKVEEAEIIKQAHRDEKLEEEE